MKISRSDILRLDEYDARRDAIRASVMEAKSRRRIQAGPLTFLFENVETIRYQIQEMIRAERLYREAEVQHEVDTYGGLLGGPGELGCTLLIELTDPGERDVRLRAWRALPEHLYARLADGRRVRPRYDRDQVGDDRLSSVQYLKFPVGGEVPVALGSDLARIQVEVTLTDDQRRALEDDLRHGGGRS
jgi:hypothetical protein